MTESVYENRSESIADEHSSEQSAISANNQAVDQSFADLLEQYLPQEPQKGKVMRGELLRIGRQGILVDIGAKRDAVVPQQEINTLDEEFLSTLFVGLEMPVVVTHTPNGTDRLEVSIRRGLEEQDWERAEEMLQSGEIVVLPITGLNKGGVLVDYRHLTGFVPNSHIPSLKYVHDDEEIRQRKQGMLGTTLPLKVIEIDHNRRRLVWSAKEAEEEQREQRLRELEPGKTVTGHVENLTDFGAFVDLGGVTGLVHISKLDWRHVSHPSEVLAIGDEVQVLVEAVDTKRGRIRLNRQAAMPNPWQLLPELHEVGSLIEGVITNITDFGVFVRIPLGIEGLIHNSELHPDQSGDNESNAFRILSPGDLVVARIISIDADRERLGLSLRQVSASEEAEWIATHRGEPTEAATEDEPVAA
jgi:small subunit ribosomal protein S1